MITPIEQSKNLSAQAGVPVYLKREDLHPLCSHKGRSIPVMIDTYIKKGITSFAISSSGNAALAAALHLLKINSNAKLAILVGEKIPDEKLKPLLELVNKNITVSKVARPLMGLAAFEKRGYTSLRQSTDESALTGYFELANEIIEGTPDVSDVFVATSSGTTAVALHKQFTKCGKHIKVHIVQTPACHPFIESDEDETSLAYAIVDKVGHRKTQIRETIKESHSRGIIARDEYIVKAQKILEDEGITTTPNGALSIAGLLAHLDQGSFIKKQAVCIIGGK